MKNDKSNTGTETVANPDAGRLCLQRFVRRTLELTLKRHWFDMVASGEKTEEYREPSKWILSRLEGKEYEFVRFRNGYSPTSPVVVCEYKGWKMGFGKRAWGGGSSAGNPIVVINLGRVIESPNDLRELPPTGDSREPKPL